MKTVSIVERPEYNEWLKEFKVSTRCNQRPNTLEEGFDLNVFKKNMNKKRRNNSQENLTAELVLA